MEFFLDVPVTLSSRDIQRYVSISKLSEYCSSIDKVVSQEGNRALVHCEMGELHIHRELIQQGVRFTLIDTPYAMQWTITSDADSQDMPLIHCTINYRECPTELTNKLEHFLSCWKNGIEKLATKKSEQEHKSCPSCGETYGGFG